MKRFSKQFEIENIDEFKQKVLQFSQQFREVIYLESNNYKDKYSTFDAVFAFDAFTSLQTDAFNGFEKLKEYQTDSNDWLFGYLTYDLKNDVEDISSSNFDGLEFPELFFFQPKKIITIKDNCVEFNYLNFCNDELDSDFKEINEITLSDDLSNNQIQIKERISKESYLSKVEKVKEHIQRGDIYEANFCMEFFAEDVTINPTEIFENLNAISHPPFASFLKNNQHFMMSASPERYIKKVGAKVVSQPIKGTAKRGETEEQDSLNIENLRTNPKERSENIMIVDLVRNDLSKTATKGSVEVEELCQIYTFEQVHQMISTIISEVPEKINPIDVLRTTFPMGSMTGAPKLSAMQIIEKLEETKRGLYSGAVGYFTPNNDFDFNVVIRSILYNKLNKYVSFSVGSAITSEAIPENEYQECILKAKAMKKVLNL
ncbi:anthranilate synthase component I family protein [Paenimyroides tangerinum]|uniref:Anthranilate synthase component I family protein n=1 Tax=Paenimyroides tangerinum TaxID=2488728 RepID=A0A3P3W7Y2_9FLAO|nr:anthranilate synthase component I family protein [Paenimyroides tangerinum]RRJ91272.1 anthranilate synthase component I family protein [Paenimyroides tangerinum]